MTEECEGVPIRKLKPDKSTYSSRVNIKSRSKAGGVVKSKGDKKLNKKVANDRKYRKRAKTQQTNDKRK